MFAKSAARDIRGYGLDDPRFRPTLRGLIVKLKQNPQQFPTKRGKLKNARAAPLNFGNAVWRLVFTVDARERVVHVLAIGPHDDAYARASRRIKQLLEQASAAATPVGT
jgi:mRNA-degrading endonuclease RelE of RelBE toxin-antitoxin system